MENIQKFRTFISEQLNDAQRNAVLPEKGSLLVVAGAGSGKTRVITARIAHLILEKNVPAHQIVALTFTNKAANEMKERIGRYLGSNSELPFIGTFHSYCLYLLKQNGELLEQPFFSILDSDDQQKMVSQLLKAHGVNKRITPSQIIYQISHLKNQMQNPLTASDISLDLHLFNEIYNAYEREKRVSKCLDFDDLLLHALALFTKYPSFKKEFQETVRHILIDEYQDTNLVQHEFLKHMAQHNNNMNIDSVCVVGDEDQSIYSWRGATVANVMNFTHDFPGTTLIKIEQNYRSVQPILEVANHVIKNNRYRNPKNLWSDRQARDRIRVIACMSNYQEGDMIAQLATIISTQQSLSSVAVLYRAHYQSRTVEEALVKYSIPYKIIGGVQFYERKEIKDLLAYLRLYVNPFDRTAFFRVINCPTRGLGAKFEELCYDRWNEQPFLSFKDILNGIIEDKAVPPAKCLTLREFLRIFSAIEQNTTPLKALELIIAHVAYISYLKQAYDTEEAQSRIDNVKELLRALSHFEANGITTIGKLLDEIALMQEHHVEDETKDPILLMTLHAAKGLEFDMVILCGLEEGLLPSSRSLVTDEGLEEERRLFYVGITRAKERLLLTHARHRYAYGQVNDQRPSRFINEIPSTLAPTYDGTSWNIVQAKSFFADWCNARISSPVHTFGSAQSTPSIRKKPLTSRTAQKTKSNISAPIARSNSRTWRINQPVSHPKFGVGIVTNIEERGNENTFLTIKFKSGTKKIDHTFVTKV